MVNSHTPNTLQQGKAVVVTPAARHEPGEEICVGEFEDEGEGPVRVGDALISHFVVFFSFNTSTYCRPNEVAAAIRWGGRAREQGRSEVDVGV
jgi:hypothetical protein